MSRVCSRSIKGIVVGAATLAVLSAGCTPVPPATAVLAGTWKLTTPSDVTNLTELLLTFDSNGNLSNVTYKIGDKATITSPTPTATTAVAGQNVTISATFVGNSLSFSGVLNDTSHAAGIVT